MSYETRVKLVLHGALKKLIPEEIYMTGNNVAEIVNGFFRQRPELRPHLGQPRWAVQVMGFESKESILNPLMPDVKELHICPVMAGGKGGFFGVVLGGVLIAASFWNPVIAVGALWSGGATLSAIMFNIGLSLALGGLLQMLSPAPKLSNGDNAQDPAASQYLGASQNTTKIGTRIPLLYGKFKCYGHYLSFNVDAKDVAL